MGLTVSRQIAQNLTKNRQETSIVAVNCQKRQFNVNRQMVSRSLESHYFIGSSRTSDSQRIFKLVN